MKILNRILIAATLFQLLALSALAGQTTDTILMISPDKFKYNDQAAKTNKFQNKVDNIGNEAFHCGSR